jgi:hypothetical protein
LERYGSQWIEIRSRARDFLRVVTELSEALGKGEEMADLSFENSPLDILPIGTVNEYDPCFGYFPPPRVVEYSSLIAAMPEHLAKRFEEREDGGLASRILYAYRSSFREALSRSCAIAIDHS